MSELAAITLPPFDGEPRQVAECWRLAKNSHTAVCSVWTHPTRRGDARVVIDGELYRSEAHHDGRTLLDTVLSWADGFKERGWR